MASDNNPSSYTATSYNKIASFVYSKQYTSAVLELLDPKPGERIIDFGCGSGELTLNLANIVGSNGLVVGVDASESMVTYTVIMDNLASTNVQQIQKTRSNGIEYAFVSDVQDLVFPSLWSADHQTFDAVFTNAALHWCARNPRGVLASAARVLRPNGRFVGEMGGFANCVGQCATEQPESSTQLMSHYFRCTNCPPCSPAQTGYQSCGHRSMVFPFDQ
jgi:ubiquinone/menaquinone biosynthesis C-methylase UbiE